MAPAMALPGRRPRQCGVSGVPEPTLGNQIGMSKSGVEVHGAEHRCVPFADAPEVYLSSDISEQSSPTALYIRDAFHNAARQVGHVGLDGDTARRLEGLPDGAMQDRDVVEPSTATEM